LKRVFKSRAKHVGGFDDVISCQNRDNRTRVTRGEDVRDETNRGECVAANGLTEKILLRQFSEYFTHRNSERVGRAHDPPRCGNRAVDASPRKFEK
jgi:hypothetical protein